jgi:hypothetical protein
MKLKLTMKMYPRLCPALATHSVKTKQEDMMRMIVYDLLKGNAFQARK